MGQTPPATGMVVVALSIAVALAGVTAAQQDEGPRIEISYPEEGDTLSGTVRIQGNASDPEGDVRQVQVRIDEGNWYRADGTESWSILWETEQTTEGEHTIYAWVEGEDGATNLTQRQVVVDQSADEDEESTTNETNDSAAANEPPELTLESPTNGQEVQGEFTIAGTASDPEGALDRLTFSMDGNDPVARQASGEWTQSWDASQLEEGWHELTVVVTDAEGASDQTTVRIQVVQEESSGGSQEEQGSTEEGTSGGQQEQAQEEANNTTAPTGESGTAPRIDLVSPAEGTLATGELSLRGVVVDVAGAESVTVRYRVDEGGWKSFEASSGELFEHTLSTAALSEGKHVLQVQAHTPDGASEVLTTGFNVNNGEGLPLKVAVIVFIALTGGGLLLWERQTSGGG